MQLDLALIKQRLFEHERECQSLSSAYGITTPARDPETFLRQVLDSLDQSPVDRVLEVPIASTEVFRAAVRAIGSNSTRWTDFLSIEGTLEQVLDGYDPAVVAAKIRDERLAIEQAQPGPDRISAIRTYRSAFDTTR